MRKELAEFEKALQVRINPALVMGQAHGGEWRKVESMVENGGRRTIYHASSYRGLIDYCLGLLEGHEMAIKAADISPNNAQALKIALDNAADLFDNRGKS